MSKAILFDSAICPKENLADCISLKKYLPIFETIIKQNNMHNEAFIAELKRESASTKRILERVPEGKFDWKPHEKSMTLGRLASHVAELSGFLNSILTMDDFDFTKGHYKPSLAKTPEELISLLQEKLDEVIHFTCITNLNKTTTTFR